jgi:hypothetical protein
MTGGFTRGVLGLMLGWARHSTASVILAPLRHESFVTTDLSHETSIGDDLVHESAIGTDLTHESTIEARY